MSRETLGAYLNKPIAVKRLIYRTFDRNFGAKMKRDYKKILMSVTSMSRLTIVAYLRLYPKNDGKRN